MNFWVVFGLFGLLFAPLTIMFAICGADAKHKLAELFSAFAFGFCSQVACISKR